MLWMKYVSVFATAMVLLIAGCSKNGTGNDDDGLDFSQGRLFVVESDYASGILEWMSIADEAMATDNISVNSDAVVRAYGGYVYVLERYGGDNVLKFDPSETDASGVIYQTHLGDNWNPMDIDFVSDTKAYVANANEAKITVFNPSTGSAVSQIDISGFTFNPDSNATPYANQMVLVDDTLYVMLQRRDGWNPGGATYIFKINTSTDAVVAGDTIVCTYKNGYDMVYANGCLYVTNPGSSYDPADGGIEKVDLATGTVSTVMTEAVFGGNPYQIVHIAGDRFYVQNYIGWKNCKVVEIDAATGAVTETLPEIVDAFGGLAYDDVQDQLYVGERDSVEVGIRIFKDNAQTAEKIKSSASLPPASMVIVR